MSFVEDGLRDAFFVCGSRQIRQSETAGNQEAVKPFVDLAADLQIRPFLYKPCGLSLVVLANVRLCPGCFDFAADEWQPRPHLTPPAPPIPASADVSILQQIGACGF
ncbi:unnamed protein product [Pleuronectes platessa]|uniref:Uncharacterized protein n=1 Tax=Pleuronectes platessa TaxID=8262 RepID=A0A9N7UPL0_PLEPL|nr:unnamed protein product [Pleuronectes platessa]